MSAETVRLIADRGHGLSKAQREAIRWLATDRQGLTPTAASTWGSLTRLGLVALDAGGRRVLTGDGITLARRMGIDAPWPSPGERSAAADRRLHEENTGITDSWRES